MKGRRKTTNAKITPDELNMIFGAIAHSKNIIELHAFFYNGMFSYLTGSGFTADYFQDGVDYSNAVGADDPYIIARNPAEAVEYVSEFVRLSKSRLLFQSLSSSKNHGSFTNGCGKFRYASYNFQWWCKHKILHWSP